MILVTLNAARRTKDRWPTATHWTISAEGVLRLWLTRHVGEEIAAYASGVWHHVEHADQQPPSPPSPPSSSSSASGSEPWSGGIRGKVDVSAGEAIR